MKRGLQWVIFPALPRCVRELGEPSKRVDVLWLPRSRGKQMGQDRLQGENGEVDFLLRQEALAGCVRFGQGIDFKFI